MIMEVDLIKKCSIKNTAFLIFAYEQIKIQKRIISDWFYMGAYQVREKLC